MTKLTIKIIIGMSVLLLLPSLGMAAQRAITVSSLDSAYKAQVASLDAKIASAQEDQNSIDFSHNTGNLVAYPNLNAPSQRWNEDSSVISKAKVDEQNLEVTYNLLVAALQ